MNGCIALIKRDHLCCLIRACRGLKPDGVIFVKENVCMDGFVLDKEDNGLTRSNAYLLEIFERAHLKVSARGVGGSIGSHGICICLTLNRLFVPNVL